MASFVDIMLLMQYVVSHAVGSHTLEFHFKAWLSWLHCTDWIPTGCYRITEWRMSPEGTTGNHLGQPLLSRVLLSTITCPVHWPCLSRNCSTVFHILSALFALRDKQSVFQQVLMWLKILTSIKVWVYEVLFRYLKTFSCLLFLIIHPNLVFKLSLGFNLCWLQ